VSGDCWMHSGEMSSLRAASSGRSRACHAARNNETYKHMALNMSEYQKRFAWRWDLR